MKCLFLIEKEMGFLPIQKHLKRERHFLKKMDPLHVNVLCRSAINNDLSTHSGDRPSIMATGGGLYIIQKQNPTMLLDVLRVMGLSVQHLFLPQ